MNGRHIRIGSGLRGKLDVHDARAGERGQRLGRAARIEGLRGVHAVRSGAESHAGDRDCRARTVPDKHALGRRRADVRVREGNVGRRHRNAAACGIALEQDGLRLARIGVIRDRERRASGAASRQWRRGGRKCQRDRAALAGLDTVAKTETAASIYGGILRARIGITAAPGRSRSNLRRLFLRRLC